MDHEPTALLPDGNSVAEKVAGRLREEIFAGTLAQGSPLREVALADAQDVSRRTVREALLLLASQRLIVHERNRGATVRTLGRNDVVDLYRVRRTLELEGARNAPFAAADDRDVLGRAYADLCDAARGTNSREMVRCDLAFHGAVVGLTGSPRLRSFYEGFSPEMEMALSVIRGGEDSEGWGTDEIIGEHRTIHDALMAHEVIEAQRTILAHIAFNERFLLDLVSTRKA